MTSHILAIGTATPPVRITMDESIAFATRIDPTGQASKAISTITKRTGVQSRASTLLTNGEHNTFYPVPTSTSDKGPTTATRLKNATHEATTLGEQACRRAFETANIAPTSITHIVTASCTVIDAPGFDQYLIENLQLSPDVRRTHVGFMGCHAAINALAVAQALTLSNPNAVVLVCCVELCTLHLHYTDRMDQLIANALFADGAAAAIITSSSPPASLPTIAGFGSRIFQNPANPTDPSTRDAMSWCVGDHGFAMTLDRAVPDLLRASIPNWVDQLLAQHNLSRKDVGAWAIHPGGPRIVQTITDCLDLPEPQRTNAERDSLGILHANGNMSSATILFILQHLQAQSRPRPWVALAFGPGLAGEALLIM